MTMRIDALLPPIGLQYVSGMVDRVTLYLPFIPGERDPFWQAMIREMKGS